MNRKNHHERDPYKGEVKYEAGVENSWKKWFQNFPTPGNDIKIESRVISTTPSITKRLELEDIQVIK